MHWLLFVLGRVCVWALQARMMQRLMGFSDFDSTKVERHHTAPHTTQPQASSGSWPSHGLGLAIACVLMLMLMNVVVALQEKPVESNHKTAAKGAVRKGAVRTYRQYMNRRGAWWRRGKATQPPTGPATCLCVYARLLPCPSPVPVPVPVPYSAPCRASC
jgi:hypothetical protein